MLKTNTVNTIALLSICISFWNALYVYNNSLILCFELNFSALNEILVQADNTLYHHTFNGSHLQRILQDVYSYLSLWKGSSSWKLSRTLILSWCQDPGTALTNLFWFIE